MAHYEQKGNGEFVIKLSPEEREIVLDVLQVERLDLGLEENKNEDARRYGKVIEILQDKLQAA